MNNKKDTAYVVTGTGFEGRAAIIRARCYEGARVDLERQPNNQFDPHAIAVFMHSSRFFGLIKTREQIGFIKSTRAEALAKKIDAGKIKVHRAYVRSFYAPPKEKVPRVSLILETSE